MSEYFTLIDKGREIVVNSSEFRRRCLGALKESAAKRGVIWTDEDAEEFVKCLSKLTELMDK